MITIQKDVDTDAVNDAGPPVVKKQVVGDGRITLWLSFDPETFRVSAQEGEFLDGSFPRGLRGTGWKTAQAEVDADIWNKMLRGELSIDEQDEYHRKWWSEAYGKTWPEI